MNKKLTAKTQELNPILGQYNTSFSKCMIIEPETKELALKKGSVYAVFEIFSDSNFDTALIGKVLQDVIYNSYYQSESVSPIQSMEKAISEARDKVVQLSNDALSSDPQSIKFRIAAAVLWGNVLYVVQYDKAESYLMRDGVIRPISTMNEGAYSAASGVVKDDDVVVLCTKDFAANIPPQKLLTLKISEADLTPTQACLLMRLIVDTSFSETETVDFNLQKETGKSTARVQTEKFLYGARENLGKKFSPLGTSAIKLFGNLHFNFKTKTAQTTITRQPGQNRPIKLVNLIKTKGAILLPIVAVALVASIVVQSVQKRAERTQQASSATTPLETTASTPAENNEVTELERAKQETEDKEFKVTRIKPEVLYDIKIADAEANPTEMLLLGDKIATVDKTSGKIFYSPLDSIKFSTTEATIPGAHNLISNKGNMEFLDNQGYKTFSFSEQKVSNQYALSSVAVAGVYSDFIYTISGTTLTRHTLENNELVGTLWGQSEDFENARSMAVAYSIYLVTKDGNLVKYTSGNKTAFSIKGVNGEISGSSKVIANNDFENIYLLDSANSRIIVLDDEGTLVKQYKGSFDNSSLKSFDINEDESKAYFLEGSKVYVFNLE